MTQSLEGEGQDGGDFSFFLYDGLGSSRSLTNSDGELTQTYNYHPFGEGIDHPGEPSTNHLFTGEYFDQDLSYYDLRARYYVPGIGRFTSFDPVEDLGNYLHRYVYAANSPIINIDISGMFVSISVGFLCLAIIMMQVASPADIPSATDDLRIQQIDDGIGVWFWGCGRRYAERHKEIIRYWAERNNIPPAFLAAIVWQERGARPALIDDFFVKRKQPTEEETWGGSFGLTQLHVWKARLAAKHVYGENFKEVWLEGPDRPAEHRNPYYQWWAERLLWSAFNLKYAVGYIRYLIDEGDPVDKKSPNVPISKMPFEGDKEYWGHVGAIYTDDRDGKKMFCISHCFNNGCRKFWYNKPCN